MIKLARGKKVKQWRTPFLVECGTEARHGFVHERHASTTN